MKDITKNNIVYDGVVFGFRSLIPQVRTIVLSILLAVALWVGIALIGVAVSVFLFLMSGINHETFVMVQQLAETGPNPFTLTLVFKMILITLPTVLALWIASVMLFAGFDRIALGVVDTGEGVVKNMIMPLNVIYRVALAGTIHGIIAIIGTCFFIIPGIIWIIRARYYVFCIIDKDAGIVDSLRQSWNMTSGYGWPLFAMLVVSQLITGLSTFVPFLLIPASLLAYFILLFAYAYIYRKLSR